MVSRLHGEIQSINAAVTVFIILTEIDVILSIIGVYTGAQELNPLGLGNIIVGNMIIMFIMSIFMATKVFNPMKIKNYKLITNITYGLILFKLLAIVVNIIANI